MREALARSDLDFTVTKTDGDRRKPEVARLPKLLRIASTGTTVLFCGLIVVNALFLQDGKHPAPLLRAPDPVDATSAAVSPPAPPQRPASIQAPSPAAVPVATQPARAARDPIADEINRLAVTPDRKPAKVVPPPRSEEKHSDPIGNLLGAAQGQAASASVMAAQKALLRLGYVVRADGTFGATTRQAIERYERDNKLPVRGELTPKLSRELAAKSGVPAQ